MFEFHQSLVRRLFPSRDFEYNAFVKYPGTPKLMEKSLTERGWRVSKIGGNRKKLRYYAPNGKEFGRISGTKLSRHDPVVDLACRDKAVTKQLMQANGVPVPRGFALEQDDIELARYVWSTMEGPVVLKPSDGAVSRGVTVGIETEHELEEAWVDACKAASGAARILLEEHCFGFDLRTFVVGGKCIALASRLQPFVIGDGISNIDLLVSKEKVRRSVHFQLASYPLSVDDRILRLQGVDRSSVIEDGKVVFLNDRATLSTGSITVEVTLGVCSELKTMAENAVKAVPGLEIAAVDLVVQDLNSINGAKVLEINQSPGLFMHAVPAVGEPVDVFGHVCEYLADEWQKTL